MVRPGNRSFRNHLQGETVMSTNKNTRKSAVDQDESLINGTRQYLMGQNLIIGKQSYTPQEIINLLQGRVTTGQAILTARTAVTAAIKADKDERSQTGSFVRGFRTIVQGMFGELPDTLAVFGLKPRKSPKKTVKVKSEAILKTEATRKARGTMGKRQKESIKGTITPPETAPKAGNGTVTPEVAPQPKA
jgi:hypothetical protein